MRATTTTSIDSPASSSDPRLRLVPSLVAKSPVPLLPTCRDPVPPPQFAALMVRPSLLLERLSTVPSLPPLLAELLEPHLPPVRQWLLNSRPLRITMDCMIVCSALLSILVVG